MAVLHPHCLTLSLLDHRYMDEVTKGKAQPGRKMPRLSTFAIGP